MNKFNCALTVFLALSFCDLISHAEANSIHQLAATNIVLSGPGQCPDTPSGRPLTADGCPRDSDGDGVPDYKDECPDTPPGAAACAYGCELRDPIVINLVNDEFDFDSAVLKPDMKTHLIALAEKVLADGRVRELSIVGHTDWTGTDDYNQGLSVRRAQAVTDFLAAHGLQALTLVVNGEGESKPIADNATPAGRAQNRRVEVFTHSSHDD